MRLRLELYSTEGTKHHCRHPIDGFTPSFIHCKHPSWCLPVTYKYVCERKDQTFIGRNLLSSSRLHVITEIRFWYTSTESSWRTHFLSLPPPSIQSNIIRTIAIIRTPLQDAVAVKSLTSSLFSLVVSFVTLLLLLFSLLLLSSTGPVVHRLESVRITH